MEAPIPIDALPESLILECLARLDLKDIPVASRVCHKWLHLIESRHFYTLRKQLGFSNQVACLLQQSPPPTFTNLKYAINQFDPMNREWNRLPPIPNFTKELPWSTSIAPSEGKLVVISECDPESRDPVKSVFVLDFATQRWRKGNGMPSIRSSKFSTAASKCHRIFISGDVGREEGAVWEYDAWKDEWTVLHRVRGGQIIGMKIIGEELWVIIGCRGIKNMRMFKGNGADVYHLQTKEWRQVELASGGVNEVLCPRTDFELYELMKNLSENNFKVLENCFRLQLGKQCLLMAPFVTLTDGYGREELFYMQGEDGNFEKMEPSSSEFSGYVGSCCCVEL
ncbi:F-box/kelch-repeat protein At2g44130-like [Impatiens glandulifera]|uniref:F-box/kelch-repeat protein At2g44130-like n=1 Tax=Impatiens glandulifera TaxID=253017 RepID=UPI001FB0570B|nr:F-box/kelch-repeat protein At2g44130-like [Impatiens glandulifera]